MIYDYRQLATSKLASLGIVVKDNRASYDMLKAKFTALKTQYERDKTAYDAEVNAFNKSGRTNAVEFQNLQNNYQNQSFQVM